MRRHALTLLSLLKLLLDGQVVGHLVRMRSISGRPSDILRLQVAFLEQPGTELERLRVLLRSEELASLENLIHNALVIIV